MKQCVRCGNWIEDEVQFCNVCGMKQEQCGTTQNEDEKPFNTYDTYIPETQKTDVGIGLAGFVLGIFSLLFSCCVGFGIILSIAGFALSVAALIKFDPAVNRNKGIIIAAIVINAVTLFWGLISILMVIPFFSEFFGMLMHEFGIYF